MTIVAESPQQQQTESAGKARELRRRIDDVLDCLTRAIDEVRASEAFQQFLAVQARFHRYSWQNSLLIAMQRPDATRVAGYRTWQALKRQVRKGEHGIMIFAPCPFHKERQRSDGSMEELDGIFFKPVHVFDVAQTDGPELPTLDVPTIDARADELLSKLARVAERRGIAVRFAPLEGGLFGVSAGGSVDVDNRHPTGQQAKTLAHELAHEAMHKDRSVRAELCIDRSKAELEAESVAYVVCTHFGLDVEVRASRYIALWDGDSKALRASLERIAATARKLIDDAEAGAAEKAVA